MTAEKLMMGINIAIAAIAASMAGYLLLRDYIRSKRKKDK